MSLEGILVTIAGFVGGFVSTLASNGSSVTLPALEFLGLPEHVANGTNRLSVVALGFAGTAVGSLLAVDLSNRVLDAVVVSGVILVLGLLFARPGHWLQGKQGTLRRFGPIQAAVYFAIGVYAGLVVLGSGFFILAALILLTGNDLRHGNAMKAFILLIIGLQSLLIFGESGEVDWSAGVPLVLGSAAGAYLAARLASREWARVWVYRFLIVVVMPIIHLLMVDSTQYVQHT